MSSGSPLTDVVISVHDSTTGSDAEYRLDGEIGHAVHHLLAALAVGDESDDVVGQGRAGELLAAAVLGLGTAWAASGSAAENGPPPSPPRQTQTAIQIEDLLAFLRQNAALCTALAGPDASDQAIQAKLAANPPLRAAVEQCLRATQAKATRAVKESFAPVLRDPTGKEVRLSALEAVKLASAIATTQDGRVDQGRLATLLASVSHCSAGDRPLAVPADADPGRMLAGVSHCSAHGKLDNQSRLADTLAGVSHCSAHGKLDNLLADSRRTPAGGGTRVGGRTLLGATPPGTASAAVPSKGPGAEIEKLLKDAGVTREQLIRAIDQVAKSPEAAPEAVKILNRLRGVLAEPADK